MGGVAVLAVAAATVFGPGLAVLLALGVRQRLLLLGAVPAASVGVALLTASGVGLLGARFGPTALVVGTAVLTLLAALLSFAVRTRRRGRRGEPETVPSVFPPLTGLTAVFAQLVGLIFLLTAVGLALRAWSRGLVSWATWNQDHDTILHAVLTTYIMRSGKGAPWQIMPADVVTGEGTVYYPDGFHLVAATIGNVFGDPVVGMNAAAAMILGAAWVCCSGALAAATVRRLTDDVAWLTLAAGVAAVIASGLYRPAYQLARDNGLLPNASALVLVPGVVAALLLVRPRAFRTSVGVGLACAGVVTVHPSSGLSVGLTVLVFWLGMLLFREGRQTLRAQLSVLAVTLLSAAVIAAPVLRGALAVSGRIGAFPPDSAHVSVARSLRNSVPLIYGGMFDDRFMIQMWPTLLLGLGLVTALVLRRALPLVLTWAVWLTIVALSFRDPNGITAPILGFFYNSAGRVRSHIAMLAPSLATLGALGLVCALLAVGGRVVRRVNERWEVRLNPLALDDTARSVGSARRPGPLRLGGPARLGGPLRLGGPARFGGSARARGVAAVCAVLLVTLGGVGYVATVSRGYLLTAAQALSQRWSNPQLYRVDSDDAAAAEWLRRHIRPGQRIMNSPNDGSTYLYVRDNLPIVEISTLGVPDSPYTYQLMKNFRYLATDPEVRRRILDMHIAWVYVDQRAPIIGADGAPDDWTGGGLMTTVSGLERLDRVPGLILAHISGEVHIYKVDRDVVQWLEDNA